MPTLHVRGVPEELYEAISDRARERGTSITAEAIALLRRAVAIDRPEQRELIERIRQERRPVRKGSPPAHTLIRRDRERS